MSKIKYTEDQVRFILDNYIKDEVLCVKETGHSLGSIKLMLQNIAATYGFVTFSEGNPMYTKIADEYRESTLIRFGSEITKGIPPILVDLKSNEDTDVEVKGLVIAQLDALEDRFKKFSKSSNPPLAAHGVFGLDMMK